MTKGISIHIGLNRVDPAHYDGWDGALSGCINDANDMRDIAVQMGYNPISLLTDGQATAANVLRSIGQAAQTLISGDILFLSYSGHGGQVPDDNNDEEDGQDETWVLYDRMVLDDELYMLWSQFASGVRIIVLSDSCHSGSVTKMRLYKELNTLPALLGNYRNNRNIVSKFRAMPTDVALRSYNRHKDLYTAIQWSNVKGKNVPIDASVLLISGCQDNQLSGDGEQNGVFTGTLLDVWDQGNFYGDYRAFWTQIVDEMPVTQTPNFYTVGHYDPVFEAQKPFTITSQGGPGSGSSVQVPQIAPSPSWFSGSPPVFAISPGINPYYAVEAATAAYLFDWDGYGNERTEDNFYGSWSDTALMTDSEYTLPIHIWERLSASANVLYYRVLTSSDPDGWEDVEISTADEEATSAPYIETMRSRKLQRA
jgi:hypothetical protein